MTAAVSTPGAMALRDYQVAETVQLQIQHELEVAELQREIAQLQGILDLHRAEQKAFQHDYRQLQEGANALRQQRIPALERQVAEARQAQITRERDAEHQVRLARQQVEASEQVLAAAERELVTLIGER